jgi:hypothetical protein
MTITKHNNMHFFLLVNGWFEILNNMLTYLSVN